MEIERKFLVDDLPPLEGTDHDEIEQGYLSLGQGGVRLRRRGDRRRLTVKRGEGLSREEVEIDLDEGQFETLWPQTEGRRVRKRRHLLEHGDLTIELDVFAGDLEGLVVAEVEFGSEDEARAFEPPSWFGREVTGVPEYLNESLALHGAP